MSDQESDNFEPYICPTCQEEVCVEESKPIGEKVFRWIHTCKCERERIEREQEHEMLLEARRSRKDRLKQIYSRSLMSNILHDCRLDNFNIRPGTEVAYEKAKEFVRDFDEKQDMGLFLFGPAGNGKSHLARGIQYELDQDGWPTLYLDWPQLTLLARETFKSGSNFSLADVIRAAVSFDLLCIDEIGIGHLSEFEFNDILFPLINGRAGKPTIYTSNLSPTRLAKWFTKDKNGMPLDEDGRLMDRILYSTEIIENSGTSYRREAAKKRIAGGASA